MHTEALMVLGLLLPLLGTTLGAMGALALRRNSPGREQQMLGFAAGVMLAASVWSLLLPAIDFSEAAGKAAWLPAALGFLLGAAAVPMLRRLFPMEQSLLFWSVTLHNIPEGMAVGVALAAARENAAFVPALALSFGIAVQNIPEGGVIALPPALAGMKRSRACAIGILSGIVEPIAAALTLLLASLVTAILPWVLAMAAGCMYFVTVESLLPAAAEEEGGSAAAVLGFALMMLLDVALG